MGKTNKTTADNALDWEKRRLCPDESCIGIVGPDGRCTECGRQVDGVDGDPPDPAAHDPETAAEAERQRVADPPEAEQPRDHEEAASTNDDWTSRQLCPDGNCIGVIGPDGRCKVCGRNAADRP